MSSIGFNGKSETDMKNERASERARDRENIESTSLYCDWSFGIEAKVIGIVHVCLHMCSCVKENCETISRRYAQLRGLLPMFMLTFLFDPAIICFVASCMCREETVRKMWLLRGRYRHVFLCGSDAIWDNENALLSPHSFEIIFTNIHTFTTLLLLLLYRSCMVRV